jgi:hypothetical protein
MTHSIRRRTFLQGAASLAALTRPASAAQQLPMRDVVVLIPGIMGSVLQKGGKDLWSPGGGIVNAIKTLGSSVDALRLGKDSVTDDVLADGVVATGLFQDTHVVPGLVKIDGYTATRRYLFSNFALTEGENYVEFPYDWRRDNRANAQRLRRSCQRWLSQWRSRPGNKDAKLILLAHSMGGLISSYFIEVLGGWQDTRMLITFGTPFRGSMKAADFLANGPRIEVAGMRFADVPALVGTFNSIYQLLPRYDCVRSGNGAWQRIADAPAIAGIDAARAKDALGFHLEIDKANERNVTLPAYVTNRYQLHAFAGTYQPTLWSGRVEAGRLTASSEIPIDDPFVRANVPNDGDGTVCRASAVPVVSGGPSPRNFFNQMHGSLQCDPAVLTQVQGLLTNDAVLLAQLRGDAVKIALSLDDIQASGKPFRFRARSDTPGSMLRASVKRLDGAAVGPELEPRRDDGAGVGWELPALPAGGYRVTVSRDGEAGGVVDVSAVS